jgi:multidrug efflux pump
MGSVRTALVPLLAMPVSLVGAGIVMFAFGFSLNLLTILAIVLSVGLVVDDAIVVVENVARHVRQGKSRVDAALVGARELLGPIVAMTITLAVVYAPIGFQGGLTGSLFLEFAFTLAAAVVVSGIVAVTLSPVMSSRFVHPHGKQGRFTVLVNRAFEMVRRAYAWLLEGALQMRWAIVAAALLITIAAWPLYMFSRQELAPVEDQSHIAFFLEASPDSTLAAANRDSLNVVRAVTAFPEASFMWSLTSAWGGFGGMVTKDWRERGRSTQEMFGEVFAAVSQAPGLRVFPRLDPPLPTPGQYDVELVLQSDAPPEQATVFGHLPLVLVTGPGAEARNSIGTVLVAGMTVGTLFTLFVVPVFYSLIAAKHPQKPTHREHEARPIDAGMDGTDHGERPWRTWVRDGEAAGTRVQ